jgi:hypothetical protein
VVEVTGGTTEGVTDGETEDGMDGGDDVGFGEVVTDGDTGGDNDINYDDVYGSEGEGTLLVAVGGGLRKKN